MPNYERSPSHLKFADGLQVRSPGGSRLILLLMLDSYIFTTVLLVTIAIE